MNGNWSQLDMTKGPHASITQVSFALTAFWGRSRSSGWCSPRSSGSSPCRTYHTLPFGLAVMFVVIALLPTGTPAAGIVVFALAGFGCSALLPLTISFGQEQLAAMGASVAGGVIAFISSATASRHSGLGPWWTRSWACRPCSGSRRSPR